jgi:uncharacterized protein (DUF1015 family)
MDSVAPFRAWRYTRAAGDPDLLVAPPYDVIERPEAEGSVTSTGLEQVREVAFSGERMPQKATFFYPKLPTGLVFQNLSGSP